MTLNDVRQRLECTVLNGPDLPPREVTGGYASDLLSDVIAHAAPGDLWITMQAHVNIVAVAVLKELAGIVIVQGRQPGDDTLQRAREEHVPILVSGQSAFATAGRLYALLHGG